MRFVRNGFSLWVLQHGTICLTKSRVKDSLTVTLLILIMSSVSVLGDNTASNSQEYFENKVKERISSGMKSGRLVELTNSLWNKACVILPYGVGVEKSAGTKIDVYTDLPWVLSETYWGILLIGPNDKFTAIRLHRLKVLDYDKRSVDGACYSRSTARFEIVTTGKRPSMLVIGSGT